MASLFNGVGHRVKCWVAPKFIAEHLGARENQNCGFEFILLRRPTHVTKRNQIELSLVADVRAKQSERMRNYKQTVIDLLRP